jgi:hypothetical protein
MRDRARGRAMALSEIRNVSKVCRACSFFPGRNMPEISRDLQGCREFDSCLALGLQCAFAHFRDVARFVRLCAFRRFPIVRNPELHRVFIGAINITKIIKASEIIKVPGDWPCLRRPRIFPKLRYVRDFPRLRYARDFPNSQYFRYFRACQGSQGCNSAEVDNSSLALRELRSARLSGFARPPNSPREPREFWEIWRFCALAEFVGFWDMGNLGSVGKVKTFKMLKIRDC